LITFSYRGKVIDLAVAIVVISHHQNVRVSTSETGVCFILTT